jgi:hypothetical protein
MMKAVSIALIFASMTCRAWAEDCTDPLVKKPEDAGRIALRCGMWLIRSSQRQINTSGCLASLSRFTTAFGLWQQGQNRLPTTARSS